MTLKSEYQIEGRIEPKSSDKTLDKINQNFLQEKQGVSLKSDKLENFLKFINHLIETKFFGEILIKMEGGNIYIIKKTESIKL